MNVLVDTSVWSVAYRRSDHDLNTVEKKQKAELAELIREKRVRLIGAVFQELLSGIRNPAKFDLIKSDLESFEEEQLSLADYRRAAEISNELRAKGVTGSSIDCLICAVALDRGMEIFTADEDFRHYARHIPLRLHTPR